ncbi:MAG: S8 family serine peptidase [Caldilineaceae bacterium]
MSKLITLLLVLTLLLTSLAPAALAQEPTDDDATPADQIYLPLITNGDASTGATEEETEESEAPSAQVAATDATLFPDERPAPSTRSAPSMLNALKLPTPKRILRDQLFVQGEEEAVTRKFDPALLRATGRRQVVVRLSESSLAAAIANNVSASAADAQLAQLARVQTQQAALLQAALRLDGNAQVLGQVSKALNAVMLEIDTATLGELAANPAVVSINPVFTYQKALTETVPYIGATALQTDVGLTGAGVTVAVLDSGIDYTHINLGGSGDPADYANNDPTVIEPGTFPTARIVGGYDFVGSTWSGGSGTPPLAPDPDPLDDGPAAGHGTHVADIIGGQRGVAPGVDLYAVKVCSSVSSSCSGVALLEGMDFALDPNGDGLIDDAVDIINMSLGGDYGNPTDDDLSLAVQYAVAYGVIVVASAGNGADKPYVHGTPASAPYAIAVAQTNTPLATLPLLELLTPPSIAGLYPAVYQSWSAPLTATIEAPIQYGDGNGGNLNGCAPFAEGSLTGKIVLVDRGACNFTLKIKNISLGGGLAGVIGLVAPGDPFVGGDGGDRPITVPAYMVDQTTAELIKPKLLDGVTARLDPTRDLPLVKHMVGSSSRGPSVELNDVKPDIGAPGASISAVAGTGTETQAFSGTSGAAPMVSGAAALLRQAFPNRSALEIKALLMNSAATDIQATPAFLGGDLAPITRIGGGEVRVDQAYHAPAAAWDDESLSGSLSFGFHDVTSRTRLTRLVNVRNYSEETIIYNIVPEFRFANDAANGAVQVIAPSRLVVPARRDAQFEVTLVIDGAMIYDWLLNSGSLGANPLPLTLNEYDGYLRLVAEGDHDSDGDDNPDNRNIHLAWQVLPRKAGLVSLRTQSNFIRVRNRGVATTTVEAYSLIGVSANLPEGGPGDNNPTPDFRSLGYATYFAPAGVCNDETDSFVLAFAGNSWERQSHANAPATYDFLLDVDRDGEDDYEVFNFDLAGDLSDGRNVTWVTDLSTGETTAFFFTDHDTNSANTVLLFCAEQIGMTLANALQPINVNAYLLDTYYGGFGDLLTDITIAPFGERYSANFVKGGLSFTTLEPGGEDRLRIADFGNTPNTTESGLLLLYRGGAPVNREAGTVVILP